MTATAYAKSERIAIRIAGTDSRLRMRMIKVRLFQGATRKVFAIDGRFRDSPPVCGKS
jgi:hypothetical protein